MSHCVHFLNLKTFNNLIGLPNYKSIFTMHFHLSSTFPLQISDCKHCFANSKLWITPICNGLTTIFNSFEDMYNRFKDRYNRYEAIHNKNISTKDLKTGTIQCSHGSFKIGKIHRAYNKLTKRIHGKIKVF